MESIEGLIDELACLAKQPGLHRIGYGDFYVAEAEAFKDMLPRGPPES